MRLWIDDIRNPPGPEWNLVARTYHEACRMLLRYAQVITHISFDHDLGESFTGYDVAKFVEVGANLGHMPRCKWQIHSQNPTGSHNIRLAMMSAERFWDRNECPFDK